MGGEAWGGPEWAATTPSPGAQVGSLGSLTPLPTPVTVPDCTQPVLITLTAPLPGAEVKGIVSFEATPGPGVSDPFLGKGKQQIILLATHPQDARLGVTCPIPGDIL